MVLGLAVNLSQPEGDLRRLLHGGLILSAGLVLVVLGGPLVRSGWECACRRKVGVELLFLAGIAGALGASLYSTWTGIGAVFYEVVAVLITVYTAGKMLTAQMRQRAISEVTRLRGVLARTRIVRSDGSHEECSVEAVEPGDTVVVFPGELIPVDGIIRQGHAFVSETPLTGEPFPVVRRAGDPVFAGSYCEDAELLIQATKSGRERVIDSTLTAVKLAQESVSGTVSQTEADRLAAWFLPVVMAASIATFFVWGWRGEWNSGVFHALAVVLVACPCALGLAVPLGLWRAIAALASRGVVVRDARVLEQMAGARQVFFDKTGTLSESQQTLVDFVTAPGFSRQDVQALVTAVERVSKHPVARAFDRWMDSTHDRSQAKPVVRSVKTIPACGVEAWLIEPDGTERLLRLGLKEWVTKASGGVTDLEGQVSLLAGDRALYVSLDHQIAGMAVVRERLRGTAVGAMEQLQRLGCRVSILTGDRQDRADALLGHLQGIEILGGLSAAEKLERVELARPDGGVIFVGDGVNDAPAIAAANVGIALGSGARLASEAAPVILAGDDISEAARAIVFSRQVMTSIRRNMLFAAFYNAAGMGLAAAGKLHPVTAALLMFASSATVSWRAARTGGLGHCDDLELPQAGGRARWLAAAGLALQVPLLIYLGSLRRMDGLVVAVTFLLLGWIPFRASKWNSPLWANRVAMMSAMLGLGNLGMLVGWWVDAGRQPVMADGICLCCQSHHYFAPGWRIPWMYLGMLLAGTLSMWPFIPAVIRGWGRGVYLATSGAGMIFGMGIGADCLLALAGPLHPHQFLIAFAGMSGGMILGMGLGCVVGETLADELRTRIACRPSDPPTS
jgi:heavy metal translocating P-type ATPase